MVVAQLVECPLPTPEICGSNPVISIFICYLSTVLYLKCVEKTKIKSKRGREWPIFLKKNSIDMIRKGRYDKLLANWRVLQEVGRKMQWTPR